MTARRTDAASAPAKSKVLFVIGTLDVGGTEVQLSRLATGLDRRRFEPVVCCLSAVGLVAEPLRAAGVRVKSFDLRGIRRRGNVAGHLFKLLADLVRLYRWMRAEAPDIVHCMLFHAYIVGGLVARVARLPLVVASRRSLSNFKAGKPHYRLAERLVNPLTDLVIANSEAVRQDALRQEKLPEDKVIVIYNGLDPDRYVRPPSAALRAELGIADAAAVVAVVANLIHYKGHRYFLEAWSDVVRRRPGSVALLIGEGPLRAELEAEAVGRDLTASLRFLGTRDDVPALLAVADVVVHPSLEEGFANAIIEAMAAGKPVVATRVGGNPEAVEDGVTGLLVPPRDGRALAEAVVRLLERPDERERFGREARRRAERRFSTARLVEQYEAVYTELARRKASPRRSVAGSAHYSGPHQQVHRRHGEDP